MAKKYYVIWKGEKTGVFDNWPTVQSLTSGRNDAQYMGFTSKTEAEAAFQSTYSKALMKRSLKSGDSKSSTQSTSTRPKKTSSNQSSSSVTKTTDIDFQLYCDGACSPNPGKSGTGMAVYHKHELKQLWYGLYQPMGTNNTAELNGMLYAFRYAKALIKKGAKVEVLSDSKYSIDCITKWARGWQAKGWTRGKGEEIKNLEIIKECFTLYNEIKAHLTITHVRGHADIEGNELSDRMAVIARSQKQASFVRYEETLDIKTILAMKSG